MNPTAVTYALQLLASLPALMQAGVDISRLVAEKSRKLEEMNAARRDPSPEEWQELNREIARLRGELHS